MTADFGRKLIRDRHALRERLVELERERGDHHEAGSDLDLRTGLVLLEVHETNALTLTEASRLVGLTRPTAYRLMGLTRKAAAR